MKILLIGKNGQLGMALEEQAKKLNLAVLSYGREDLDITDYDKVNKEIAANKPDVVINASAFHVVPECENYPDKAFAINASSLKNLAEVCERTGSVLVHYSTDYVFDGLKGIQYEESDKPNPLQVYGISKVSGESFILNYLQKGIVIRTCGVYGGQSGSRSKKGNFVLNILKQVVGKEELEVSSEQIVNPTYAVDLAEATLQLIQKKDAKGIYHLVNEGYCSWAEFAQCIVEYKKIKTKIIPVDRGGKAGILKRPLFSALKNTRAKQLRIVLPPWQQGLYRYLDKIL